MTKGPTPAIENRKLDSSPGVNAAPKALGGLADERWYRLLPLRIFCALVPFGHGPARGHLGGSGRSGLVEGQLERLGQLVGEGAPLRERDAARLRDGSI